ncbi:thermonuclease family protein [Hydrogenophaga palleronii]|uniref:thermonuclease family protein n=1 Tax=Hydrogenophaga palleronii TaxID=65655 RepID=UPI000826E872|nr:hypothetical protein [Hydrogenophaga palleronii]
MSVGALLCWVVAISDGDTLKARCGVPGAYEQITIRIAAIDAPEKAQAFGNVSRQHLSALCFQQTTAITVRGTDRSRCKIGFCRNSSTGPSIDE